MHFVDMNLALMACFGVVKTICFHRQPVIASPYNLLRRGMRIDMGSKVSFVYFLDQHVYFVSIHVYEQNHVMIPFIEHVVTREGFGC